MKISEILTKDNILFDGNYSNKFDLIAQLVDNIVRTNGIKDKDKLYQDVIKREKIMSTGVGKGVALPHAKTNIKDVILGSLAILKTPIDFDSLDKEPVHIVFLLIGSESNVGAHLRILSKISRIISNDAFKNELLKENSPEKVLSIFQDYEDNL